MEEDKHHPPYVIASISETARGTGFSEFETRKHLKELEKKGAIVADRKSDTFYLNPEIRRELIQSCVAQWRGDPLVFRSASFQERCRQIIDKTGSLEALVTYLFVFERSGKNASTRLPNAKPLTVFVSDKDKEKFANDPEDQARLAGIALIIINRPTEELDL